jgi:hypothetical protein
MRGTGRAAVRGPIIVAAAAAVVALAVALVVPVVEQARDRHQTETAMRHQRHALAIAARVDLPTAFTPTNRLGGVPCVDDPAGAGNLRCWLAPGTPTNTTQTLDSALRAAGLSPSKAICRSNSLAFSSTSTQACRITAHTQGWDIDLVAITNVVFDKLVRPKPGQRIVPPKAHVVGTEVVLGAESQ